VNIPLMRQNEVMNGVAVYDQEGNRACTSKLAARTGISQVIINIFINIFKRLSPEILPTKTFLKLTLKRYCVKKN
jgi:hypothetical protein